MNPAAQPPAQPQAPTLVILAHANSYRQRKLATELTLDGATYGRIVSIPPYAKPAASVMKRELMVEGVRVIIVIRPSAKRAPTSSLPPGAETVYFASLVHDCEAQPGHISARCLERVRALASHESDEAPASATAKDPHERTSRWAQ